MTPVDISLRLFRIVIGVLIRVTSYPLFSIPHTSARANDEDLTATLLLHSNYLPLLVNDTAYPSRLVDPKV